jgi:hypothetical protein
MKKIKRPTRHPAADLFGEIPVTWGEVLAWSEAVGGVPASSWRLRWYVTWWNVPEKVAQAKRAGQLGAILGESGLPYPVPALNDPGPFWRADYVPGISAGASAVSAGAGAWAGRRSWPTRSAASGQARR